MPASVLPSALRSRVLTGFGFALSAATLMTSAAQAADPLITFTDPSKIAINRSSNPSTIGVTFTAGPSTQFVTALGIQAITYDTGGSDLDGNAADFATLSALPNDHAQVELRDTATGTILASSFITAANSSAGADGYFYTSLLLPVTLVPGVQYTIDAYDASENIHYLDTNNGGGNPAYTLNSAFGGSVASVGGSGGDVLPTGAESTGLLRYAPANALISSSVPEPASLGLLGLAGFAAFGRRRQR